MKRKIVSYVNTYRPLIENSGVDMNEMYLFGLEKQSRPSVNYMTHEVRPAPKVLMKIALMILFNNFETCQVVKYIFCLFLLQ